MSGITSAQVVEQLSDALNQSVAETLPRSSDYMQLLSQYGRIVTNADNPNGIQWEVEVTDRSDATFFTPGEPAPATSSVVYKPASLSWAGINASIEISELDEIKLSKGMNKIGSFFVRQIKRMSQKFVEKMNTATMGGLDPKGFTGQTVACNSTGTYAGIDRAVYAQMASYIKTAGGPLTEAMLDDVYLNFVETYEGNFTVIVGNQTTVNHFSGLANVQTPQRVNPGDVAVGTLGVGSARTRLVPQYFFMDAPVIPVKGWATGRLDFLDLSSMDGPEFQLLQDFTLKEKASTNTMRKFLGTAYCQYVIRNPRRTAAAIISIS